jgi:hypothetical protein
MKRSPVPRRFPATRGDAFWQRVAAVVARPISLLSAVRLSGTIPAAVQTVTIALHFPQLNCLQGSDSHPHTASPEIGSEVSTTRPESAKRQHDVVAQPARSPETWLSIALSANLKRELRRQRHAHAFTADCSRQARPSKEDLQVLGGNTRSRTSGRRARSTRPTGHRRCRASHRGRSYRMQR